MSDSDDNDASPDGGKPPEKEDTGFDFDQADEPGGESIQQTSSPVSTDDDIVEDGDIVGGGASDDTLTRNDFDEDDFVEDDFEDDFEDDWAEDPVQDSKDAKGNRGGGSRNDLMTKAIIGVGVLVGLGVIYIQVFTGGAPQSQTSGTPPQPTAVQTQNKQKANQQENLQKKSAQQQGTGKQAANQQGNSTPESQQAKGFMNDPGQLETANQRDNSQIPEAPNKSNLYGTQNENRQQSDNAGELPTPDPIKNQPDSSVGSGQTEIRPKNDNQLPGINKTDKAEEGNVQRGKEKTASDGKQQGDRQTANRDKTQSQEQSIPAAEETQKNREVIETLNKMDGRLNTVMQRLDTMEQRIEAVDERTKQDKQESESGVQAETIRNLRDQIRQMEEKVNQSQKQPAPQNARQQEQVAQQKARDPANPPISDIKKKPYQIRQQSTLQKRRQPESPDQWILRSARPGLAYIVNRSGGSLKSITTRDRVSGLGQITAIYQRDGRWVVQGTKGSLRQ